MMILIPLGLIAGALLGLLATQKADAKAALEASKDKPAPIPQASPAPAPAAKPTPPPAPTSPAPAFSATDAPKTKAPPPAKRDDQPAPAPAGWGPFGSWGKDTEAKTEPKPRAIAEPKKLAEDTASTAVTQASQTGPVKVTEATETKDKASGFEDIAGWSDAAEGSAEGAAAGDASAADEPTPEGFTIGGAGDEVWDSFTSTLAKVPLFGLAAAPLQAAKVGIDKATGHDPNAAEKAAAAAAAKPKKKGGACKPCEKKKAAAEESAKRALARSSALTARIREWNADRPHWPWSRISETTPPTT